MTDPHSHTTGQSLEQILERVIFDDPATHPIRDAWHEALRTEHEVLDRICREEYDRRLAFHQACNAPYAEAVARRETDLCRPLYAEESDRRLAGVWADVLRRVRAVLAGKTAE